MRSRLRAKLCSAAAGDGVGIEEVGYRDARSESFKSVEGGIVKTGGTGKMIVAGVLKEYEGGLLEAAVGNDGLADHGCLAIEVLDAAAGEIEARICLHFLTGMTLAELANLVDGELVFKGEKDHADGGDDLGHGDDANGPGGFAVIEEREGLADVERPAQEAEAGEDGSGRDAPEDVKDEDGGDKVDGALNEDEGPCSSDTNADP